VARLKERLGRVENAEADHRQLVQQLETDKATMANGQEQQRQVFDKCLDEIANHVFQALISQKVNNNKGGVICAPSSARFNNSIQSPSSGRF